MTSHQVAGVEQVEVALDGAAGAGFGLGSAAAWGGRKARRSGGRVPAEVGGLGSAGAGVRRSSDISAASTACRFFFTISLRGFHMISAR